MAAAFGKMLVHEGCDLVHIQIDVGNGFQANIFGFLHFFYHLVQHFFCIYTHSIFPLALYITVPWLQYIVYETRCKDKTGSFAITAHAGERVYRAAETVVYCFAKG